MRAVWSRIHTWSSVSYEPNLMSFLSVLRVKTNRKIAVTCLQDGTVLVDVTVIEPSIRRTCHGSKFDLAGSVYKHGPHDERAAFG